MFRFALIFGFVSSALAGSRTIEKFGFTVAPNFVIPTTEKSSRCPAEFPYAFKAGKRCCRHQWKLAQFAGGFNDCDGNAIDVYSECCADSVSVPCPDSQICRSHVSPFVAIADNGLANEDRVFILDMEDKCAFQGQDYPESGLHHKAAASYNGRLMACGGTDSATSNARSACYVADEVVSSWTQMTSASLASGASLITGDKGTELERVILAGGVADPPGDYEKPLEYGNGIQWDFIAEMSLPTDRQIENFCFAQIAENRFFLAGYSLSHNASDPTWPNHAHVYELGVGWRRVANVPWTPIRDPTKGVSCAMSRKGKLALAGGGTTTMPLFNPVTEGWSKNPDMKVACDSPGIVDLDGRLHLFGSCGGDNADIYALEKAGYWKKLLDISLPFNAGHTQAVHLDDSQALRDTSC